MCFPSVSLNVVSSKIYGRHIGQLCSSFGGKHTCGSIIEQDSCQKSADKTVARSNSSIYPDPPEPIGSFSAGPSVGGRSPVGRVHAVPKSRVCDLNWRPQKFVLQCYEVSLPFISFPFLILWFHIRFQSKMLVLSRRKKLIRKGSFPCRADFE